MNEKLNLEELEEVSGGASKQKFYWRHYVKKGETLSGLAVKYGVPLEQIIRENNIKNPNLIKVGDPILIEKK